MEDDRWKQAAGALSPMDVCDMLSACLSSMYFVFGEVYYKQVFGTAMGSSVSAVIAKMVVEDLEECTILSLRVQPRVWFRNVDDTFVICPTDTVDSIHKAISKTFSSINFTLEDEKNGALPFRDMPGTRDPKGTLKVTV